MKGTLNISSKNGAKVRALRLVAEGIEKTEINVQSSSSSSTSTSGTTTNTNTYSDSNTFFLQDLTNVLQQLNMSTIEDKNKEMVMVPSGIKEIPFEFTIPINAFPSYKGKCASIKYHVKATADREHWMDKNKEIVFSVLNSKYKADHINIDKSSDDHLKTNSIDIDSSNISNKKPRHFFDDIHIIGIRGETAKSLDDYNLTNFYNSGRYRDTYLQENLESKVEFIDEGNDNLIGSSSRSSSSGTDKVNTYFFSPGQTIKGIITIWKELIDSKKTNQLEISINGMEYAYAQGRDTINRIEGYELKANLKDKLEEIQSKNIMQKTDGTEIDKRMGLEDTNNSRVAIPFEIKIPDIVNRSYVGKYSEYFWGFDAKLNVPFSKDIHARALIEIV